MTELLKKRAKATAPTVIATNMAKAGMWLINP
jgi:hypothetical protein